MSKFSRMSRIAAVTAIALIAMPAVADSAPAQAAKPAAAAHAPDVERQRAAMEKLAFLRGHWVGEKRARKADGSIEVSRSRDDIDMTPDGLLLKIQGRAYAPGAPADAAAVMSNFGLVRFDDAAQRYRVYAFALGNALTGSGEAVGDGIVWTLEGPAQWVRFTINPAGPDGWTEAGEFSFDSGKTWAPAFEIKFQRAR